MGRGAELDQRLDADGDAATQYQFFDAGAAMGTGYLWTVDVGQRAANAYITVTAAELATTWVRGGRCPAGSPCGCAAFDGTDWSPWDPFTLTTIV